MDARRAATLLILVACGPRPLAAPSREPAPGVLGAPERVATDGDLVAGADEKQLVVCKLDGSQAHTFTAPGSPQQLVAANGIVVAGWGIARTHMDARARIIAYVGGTQEAILEPDTTRAEIAALRFSRGRLLYAFYDSKYFVRLGIAERTAGRWTTREVGRFRMASSLDELPDGKLVVGRIYGDDIDTDGDAFILEGRTSKLLPTTRGVRALVAGAQGIFLADGWHREYANQAKGLVTRISGEKAQLVEDTPGQFMVWKLELCDLDGDGVPELLGVGNKYLRAWKPSGQRFLGTTINHSAADFDAAPGLVVVAGSPPQFLRWKKR